MGKSGQCNAHYPPTPLCKTLNMSMVEQFFSVDYADRGDLFENLNIWKEIKEKQYAAALEAKGIAPEYLFPKTVYASSFQPIASLLPNTKSA